MRAVYTQASHLIILLLNPADCGMEFTRRYNIERHRDTKHTAGDDGDDINMSIEESHSYTIR